MWDGLATLIFLSLSLAVSSYLAGSLPLSFSLSRKHMRLLTACGTGILVGTALIVIIPEGVETLYSARSVGTAHRHTLRSRHAPLQSRSNPNFDSARSVAESRRHELDAVIVRRSTQKDPSLTGPDDGKPASGKADADQEKGKLKDKHDDKAAETKPSQEESHHKEFEPHAWIGISVIVGFVLMYLIDKLPKIASAQSHLQPAYISLERMGIRGSSEVDDDDPSGQGASNEEFKPSSTTTGLVIHAAADGIALGASSTSSTQNLSMIILFALMIHKAPAAFGLTAVLLKQGLSKRRARAHLLVFSLAAPVGALATWLFAHIIGGGSLGHASSTTFITGLLLLFSGGTFLYVAMHTMQDSGHDHSSDHEGMGNGYADIYQQQAAKQAEGPTLVDTLATVGGMFLPLLTQLGHSH